MTKLCTILIVLNLFCFSSWNTHAQDFANGSFEELTPGAYVETAFDRMEDAAAEGWSMLSGSPDWFFGPGVDLWDTNWGNYFQHAGTDAPAGPAGGSLADTLAKHGATREGISQSVSGLTVGLNYRVAFAHANGFFAPVQPSVTGGWEVYVDDTSVVQASSTNSTMGASFPFTTDWDETEFTFTATSSTHTFSFLPYIEGVPMGQSVSFQWIDNVRFVQAVPEPTSVVTLSAMLGMSLLRRRRKK